METAIQSVHEKIKYSCNLCGRKFSQKGNLNTHIQSVHEKIKYSCNQCDYQATHKGSPKIHIQSIHEKKGILVINVIIKLQHREV